MIKADTESHDSSSKMKKREVQMPYTKVDVTEAHNGLKLAVSDSRNATILNQKFSSSSPIVTITSKFYTMNPIRFNN